MNPSTRLPRRPRKAWPTARTVAGVIAVAAVALLAAACSSSPSTSTGGSSTSTGGSSNGGASASASVAGSSSPSLVAFSQCMRAHGVPNFPDPQQGATNAKFPDAQQLGVSSAAYQTAENQCVSLLPPGTNNQYPAAEVPVLLNAMVQFSQCMRSHGLTNWPDPTQSNGHLSFNLLNVNPPINTNSPQFNGVLRQCGHLLPHQLKGIPITAP